MLEHLIQVRMMIASNRHTFAGNATIKQAQRDLATYRRIKTLNNY